nr:serine/threonine protein phosphatase 2A 59 kDa regulatory subunit B' gamma isoform-like [Populus alba]
MHLFQVFVLIFLYILLFLCKASHKLIKSSKLPSTSSSCSMKFELGGRKGLYLWNNDHIENLIRQNSKARLPIIFPALEKNGRNHWNQVVQSLTVNARKIFADTDPELFEECLRQFQEHEAEAEEFKTKQEATWKRLEEIAATKAASSEAVLVPRAIPTSTSSS